MLLKKLSDFYIKNEKIILLTFFLLCFVFSRGPYLNRDVVNPDSVNWHTRSEQFVNGLKYFQLDKTYQHYQPGVTLMWIMGSSIEVVKQLFLNDAPYSRFTFPIYDLIAKITVVTFQLVLSFLAIYLFSRFFDLRKAVLIVLAFSMEPFFIGNSRLVHLDILLSLLLLNGLLLSFWAVKEFSWAKLVISALLFALAFLTKSIGVGGFLFAAGVGGLVILFDLKKTGETTSAAIKKAFKFSGALTIGTIALIFLFWPALWVNFKEVLEFLYYGAFRVGLAKGHNQVFLEDSTRDAGWLFYPVVLLYKTSIFTSLGVLLAAALSLREVFKAKSLNFKKFFNNLSIEHYLLLFYIGYFVVMSVSSKKIDRYAVIMYPMLTLLAVSAYYKLYSFVKTKNHYFIFLNLLIAYSFLLPIFSFYPYYFTYTNPLLGSPKYVHENILAQKPFGVGMYEVRDLIDEKYGSNLNVALIDPKPMAAIYGNENALDVAVVGTRGFDILVLGVNEKMPGKISRGKYEFTHSDSIFINGLEYWRIYVRGAEKTKTP
uniref:Glycosyltransferase RgtA/B/C/D-like domain-containing protein n=1 Tax=candidate division WWE3 bacterium TaxID=2053526 RepID=A0A7C4TJR0_UNCKA